MPLALSLPLSRPPTLMQPCLTNAIFDRALWNNNDAGRLHVSCMIRELKATAASDERVRTPAFVPPNNAANIEKTSRTFCLHPTNNTSCRFIAVHCIGSLAALNARLKLCAQMILKISSTIQLSWQCFNQIDKPSCSSLRPDSRRSKPVASLEGGGGGGRTAPGDTLQGRWHPK